MTDRRSIFTQTTSTNTKMVLNKTKGAARNQLPPKAEASETSAKPKMALRPKSPARTKSPALTRSPARTKSPARKSPSRTKKDASPPPLQSSTPKVAVPKARSPIRKSPRKSPTRVVKVTKSAETYFTERVQRPRRTRLEAESDSDTPDGAANLAEKPQATVKGRARRLEVQVEKLKVAPSASDTVQPSTFNLIRRVAKSVTQNSQSREVERVVHLRHFDNVAQKLGEFSDEDETVEVRKSLSVERGGEFKQITEFGGPLGALFLTIIAPVASVALFAFCNEKQCSFVKVPDYKKYLLLSTYFDLFSVLGFIGYAVLLAILSVIPFGGKQMAGMPTKQGKLTYLLNGFFSCVTVIAITLLLEVRGIPVTDFIVKHLFHLLIASMLFGVFLSLYAYVRSFYVPLISLNAHVVGRSRIYGFFLGRELNPRVFGLLDLKLYTLRLTVAVSLLIDYAYLYRNITWIPLTVGGFDLRSPNANSTLFVIVLLHTVYLLDVLVFESALLTSFEIQYEGFGYLSGFGYMIHPFFLTSVTRYVSDYKINLDSWKLLAIGLVFTFGYSLFRGSNYQKDAFRKNPYNPSISHLETIPTTKGKKLICSGFWGVVRHPNYLGDILINLCFVPFAFHVPPVICAIFMVVFLTHRAVRDNVRCKEKYGAAWDRYCNKVKYLLLPLVY